MKEAGEREKLSVPVNHQEPAFGATCWTRESVAHSHILNVGTQLKQLSHDLSIWQDLSLMQNL